MTTNPVVAVRARWMYASSDNLSIVDLLRENGMDDTLVLVGGIVPTEDIPDLKSKGIAEVFLPGTSTEDIVTFIRQHVRAEG